MVDKYVPAGGSASFGTYATMSGVVNSTAKTEIAAMFTSVKGLFTSTTNTGAAEHPDFNKIDPATRAKLNAELDAMAAAIAASPSA